MRTCLRIFDELTQPIVSANGDLKLPLHIYGNDSGYVSPKRVPTVLVCLQMFAASGAYQPSFREKPLTDNQLKFKAISTLITPHRLEEIFFNNPTIRHLHDQCLALRHEQTLMIPQFKDYEGKWDDLISSWWLYILLCLTPLVPAQYYSLEVSRDAYLTMFRIYHAIFNADYLAAPPRTEFTPPLHVFGSYLLNTHLSRPQISNAKKAITAFERRCAMPDQLARCQTNAQMRKHVWELNGACAQSAIFEFFLGSYLRPDSDLFTYLYNTLFCRHPPQPNLHRTFYSPVDKDTSPVIESLVHQHYDLSEIVALALLRIKPLPHLVQLPNSILRFLPVFITADADSALASPDLQMSGKFPNNMYRPLNLLVQIFACVCSLQYIILFFFPVLHEHGAVCCRRS